MHHIEWKWQLATQTYEVKYRLCSYTYGLYIVTDHFGRNPAQNFSTEGIDQTEVCVIITVIVVVSHFQSCISFLQICIILFWNIKVTLLFDTTFDIRQVEDIIYWWTIKTISTSCCCVQCFHLPGGQYWGISLSGALSIWCMLTEWVFRPLSFLPLNTRYPSVFVRNTKELVNSVVTQQVHAFA